jgi:hypothetical protein
MKIFKCAFIMLFLGLVFTANRLLAADDAVTTTTVTTTTTADKPMDPKMAEMMQKFQEYSTPTENHKILDTLAGSWDHTVTSWMAPDAPPETSSGTTENEWIMDGRFIQGKSHGMFMGKPFEGMSLLGYDNLKKEYQTVWIDNMATGMMTGTAKYDTSAKTLTDTGHFTCPLVGGDRTYRAITTLKDNDHYAYEMYMNDPTSGKEFKAMEINYTRKK